MEKKATTAVLVETFLKDLMVETVLQKGDKEGFAVISDPAYTLTKERRETTWLKQLPFASF